MARADRGFDQRSSEHRPNNATKNVLATMRHAWYADANTDNRLADQRCGCCCCCCCCYECDANTYANARCSSLYYLL